MKANTSEEELLDRIARLLDRLLEPGGATPNGSHLSIVYVARGAQHVDRVENQYIGAYPAPGPAPERGGEKALPDTRGDGKASGKGTPFDKDTPLADLFRESHHKELRQIIDSWRPYLTDADPDADALQFSTFQFDLSQIRPATVYLDFAHLINHDALQSPMSVLAAYMFQHSNLSRSENALYVQMKRYRRLCE